MGIFVKKTKVKLLPKTDEYKAGGKFLTDLLSQGTPEIPVLDVAKLTPIQRLVQESLSGLLADTTASSEAAKGELTKTLEGKEYDPLKGDYYKNLTKESEKLKAKGLTGLRQRAGMAGMFLSTPALGEESKFLNLANTNLLKQLGAMYEAERDKRLEAATQLQDVQQQQIANLASIGGIAEHDRLIEEQRNQNLFQAAMQTTMFPYTNMSNIANALLNTQHEGIVKGGGLTDLAVAAPLIAKGIAAIFGGAFGGGGG